MNILGYNYKLIKHNTKEELGGNVGLCSPDDLEISVACDVSDEAKSSILIHEIIEAIDYHLELKLKHRQIMALEMGINQILSNNGVNLNSLLDND